MTLRNSFLTDARENMRRRNWIFWLSFLGFFCYFPGYLILGLNTIKDQHQYRNGEELLRLENALQSAVSDVMGLNAVMMVGIIVLAILIGMQGFAYLHNKKQVDFYHSQPVSRNRRFLTLWANGIFIFACTYLVNLVLGMAVAAVYGAMSFELFKLAMEAFFLYLLLFLGIYHLAIIAVLLTGNMLVAITAVIVFLGYEVAARGVYALYSSAFLSTYHDNNTTKIFDTLFSPIVVFGKYLAGDSIRYDWEAYTYPTQSETILSLLILAVVFGVIAWFLYGKRKSETHGSSISFFVVKEPVRVLLLVMVGSVGGLLIYALAGHSLVLTTIGILFFTALSHAVIQLIYEVDFKAIRKKLPGFAVGLIGALVVFYGFRYDITGYDKRLPAQSKVESVYVDFSQEVMMDARYIDPADGREIYGENYARSVMKITDLDAVYALLNNRVQIEINGDYITGYVVDNNEAELISVFFTLKNGEVEYRKFYFNYEENLEAIDKLYRSEEYLQAKNQILQENFYETCRIYEATYNNGFYWYDTNPGRVKALVEAYNKDVRETSYGQIYHRPAVGQLTFKGSGFADPEFTNRWDAVIYEDFRHTIALLEQMEIPWKAEIPDEVVENIESLTIQWTDYDKLYETGAGWEDSVKEVTYEDAASIRQIMESVIPGDLAHYVNGSNRYEDNFNLSFVYTDENEVPDEYYQNSYLFPLNGVPDFIQRDLERTEYGVKN